jgi:hypothetical protein
MTLTRVLRNGWMDLLSAAAFLFVWLLRDHLEYDSLRHWLLWPVVFELFAAVALLLAGMLGSLRSDVARNLWFAGVGGGYVFAAWLTAAIADMPHAWIIAVWLLVARLVPPTGLRFGAKAHRHWVFTGAGFSGLLWGAGFVLMMLLMLGFSEPEPATANAELRSRSPAWIFPLVWVPYFVAEALLRAWRSVKVAEPR